MDLIRRLRGAQAYGLTSPLVTKADGSKFGKTEAGSVWLDPARTSPYAFFQFWLRTVDGDVGSYLRRFTFMRSDDGIEEAPERGHQPPTREAGWPRRTLAIEMTAMVHGASQGPPGGGGGGRSVYPEEIKDLGTRYASRRLVADAPTTVVGRR